MIIHLGSDLTAARQSERELLNYNAIAFRDDRGELIGLRWPYRLNDQGMRSPTKSCKGDWTGNYWSFPTVESANSILALLQKKFPNLPLLEATGKAVPETGTSYAVMLVSDGLFACLLSRQLSYFTSIPGLLNQNVLFSQQWATGSSSGQPRAECNVFAGGKAAPIAIIASPDMIGQIIDGIAAVGATEQPTLAEQFQTLSKVKVSTSGWAVEVQIDLRNPRHWSLTRSMNSIEKQGDKVLTTRRKWPSWKEKIASAGLEWEGDDPEAQNLSVPANFDEKRVQGWDTPAPNGHLLHAYQKEGAQFCASRGMRALIGDEMGVGKTVQAIAAAEATAAPRVVVICPANARYVWNREIQEWGGQGSIQHIESQNDRLDSAARWHILTYDLIAARSETWRLNDAGEVKAFVQAFPKFAESKNVVEGKFPRKIPLDMALIGVPNFSDPKRIAAWEKMMHRLRGELLEQFFAAGPLLVILDEAHRVKNRDAKRTHAIKRITEGEAQVLMLTGTPLRNNEHEAAVLLSLLDANAAKTLSTKNGYSIQDVKDYLGYFMIRRTKAEVLPELPGKTRQRIDLDKLDPDAMEQYREALAKARRMYDDALKQGRSEAAARQYMQGSIEMARTVLGTAKILGGGVADLVLDVVENKGCCVVFCAHHDASDRLKAQLGKENRRVAIIDGRTPQKERATIVTDFQEGRLDVVIGGINAAGEAITLTRADTVIFAELDWVPAALLQAEDRIHRVGQRRNCQIIQLVARMSGDNIDEMMVGLLSKKMIIIGAVLDEDVSNIIAQSVTSELHDLLLGKAAAAEDIRPAGSGSVTAEQHQEQNEPVDAVIPIEMATSGTATEAIHQSAGAGEEKTKPRRGRPKVYIDNAPPTSTERSKQSIKALAAAGGKRVMLRLSPDAHEALKIIMAITGEKQETTAINQAIVARKNELLRTSTKNQITHEILMS